MKLYHAKTVEPLLTIIQECADQFAGYAVNHRAKLAHLTDRKAIEETLVKAEVNEVMAATCLKALADFRG